MRNFIQKGDVITVIAPTALLSGQGVLIGNLFGVATKATSVGGILELATQGVFTLPKAANIALDACARVSWDAANNQIVAPASGMAPVGVVTLAAANGTTSARVRLDGVSTAVAA
ncbi:MAG: capsid cement protein [Bdellovibrionales bacterium]|jgi:predicted RecA/RadA family phage recombinase